MNLTKRHRFARPFGRDRVAGQSAHHRGRAIHFGTAFLIFGAFGCALAISASPLLALLPFAMAAVAFIAMVVHVVLK